LDKIEISELTQNCTVATRPRKMLYEGSSAWPACIRNDVERSSSSVTRIYSLLKRLLAVE